MDKITLNEKERKLKKRLKKQEKLKKKKEARKIRLDIKKSKKEKYGNWSKSVKERDNYICQICNKHFDKPHSLQSMHILSKENYPELMYDINNGLTGCFFDHKNSPLSSHLDGFAFSVFFKEKFPDRYEYLVKKLEELRKIKISKTIFGLQQDKESEFKNFKDYITILNRKNNEIYFFLLEEKKLNGDALQLAQTHLPEDNEYMVKFFQIKDVQEIKKILDDCEKKNDKRSIVTPDESNIEK